MGDFVVDDGGKVVDRNLSTTLCDRNIYKGLLEIVVDVVDVFGK